MYEAVRNNIIKNFLNRNYLWTCVVRKEAVFEDMVERSPFPFNYDYDRDILMVNIGDNISISFTFVWDTGEAGQGHRYHLVKIS